MKIILERCVRDAIRKDPKVYTLYQATGYPPRFYASEKIVRALLEAEFKSEIDEPEGGKGGGIAL
jgi:hypothetical protein